MHITPYLYFKGGCESALTMKGCAILIEEDNADSAQSLFEALSAGGRVTVPFKKQFWGDHYGNFTDKFGVQWAIRSPATA